MSNKDWSTDDTYHGPGNRFETPARPFEGNDRFRVLRCLGAGGMGIVYEVLDRQRNSMVALKTLRSLDADALLRFKNEFRALADLHHRNLVSLGELLSENGQYFFTMELIEGVEFLDWVSGNEARLRAALPQLAEGLAALHGADKVHRDIKPSNIMVTKAGRVVLLDFGLATDLGHGDGSRAGVVGTVDYMAPEQAASKPVGPEADWYSVGVVLYEALAGCVPFAGAPLEVLTNKQRMLPPPPGAMSPAVAKDLEALCMDLLRPEPTERPRARQVLQRLGIHKRQTRTPSAQPKPGGDFVGRARELATLAEAFHEVTNGRSVTVIIHGESGVGKSALVRRFTDELSGDALATVLFGRCYERETVPYKAFDGVIDSLSRHLMRLSKSEVTALLPTKVSSLAQLFPVLRRVEAIAQAPRPRQEVADPRELRRRGFHALRELFTRMTEQNALVIVIDDLQWADADSLALLSELMQPPDEPPLLLIGTAREPSTDENVRNVSLQPLPREEARALASMLLRKEPSEVDGWALGETGDMIADPDAIAAEAGGHPMFIDELVRHVAAGEAMQSLRLEDALWSRINWLEPPVRGVLELVVVAGAPLPQETAARAAELPLQDFSQKVSQLRVGHLVRTASTDRVEPFHDRVRAAVLRNLTPERKRACHERLAIAMESDHLDPEPLAIHWRGAGDSEKAARYAAQAAHQAAQTLAFDRAARLYRTAIELGPADRELHVKLGDALANAGHGAEAADAYLAAANHGDELEMSRRAAEQLLRAGHVERGLQVVSSVLGAAGMSLAPTPRRALASVALRRLQLRLRGLSFRERDPSQIRRADLAKIDVCWSVAVGLAIVDTIRGADFQTRHLLLALDAGEPYRVGRALAMEAMYAATGGGASRRRVAKVLALAEAQAAKHDHPHVRGLVHLAGGMAAFLDGRWRDAREKCAAAEQIFRDRCTGVAWELASAQAFRLWSMYFLGQLDELTRDVPLLLKEAEARGDVYAQANLRTEFVHLVRLMGDDVEGARREATEAMARWPGIGFHLEHFWEMHTLAQIDLYANDPEAAYARVREQWKALEGSLLPRIVQQLRIEVLYLRGRCALSAARMTRDREEQLRRVAVGEADARRLERENMPWATPLASMLRASAAAMRQGAEIADEARAAIAGFDAADMPLHAHAARWRLGERVDGEEGAKMIADAEAWLRELGVVSPHKMIALVTPPLV